MSKKAIQIQFVESVENDVAEMQERIRERAHQIFVERGSRDGSDLEDWLSAENELIWKPAVSVSEHEDEFVADLDTWELTADQLEIKAAGNVVLLRTKAAETGRRLFCQVEFPAEIASGKLRADYRQGSLNITLRRTAIKKMTA